MSEEQVTPSEEVETPAAETPPAEQEEQGRGGAEAKRYRLQLRSTEQERDGLREELDSSVKSAVSAIIAATAKVNPETLWSLGSKPADFLKDGVFDVDHIRDAALAAAKDHGLMRRAEPDRGQGRRDTAAGTGKTWSQVLQGG